MKSIQVSVSVYVFWQCRNLIFKSQNNALTWLFLVAFDKWENSQNTNNIFSSGFRYFDMNLSLILFLFSWNSCNLNSSKLQKNQYQSMNVSNRNWFTAYHLISIRRLSWQLWILIWKLHQRHVKTDKNK